MTVEAIPKHLGIDRDGRALKLHRVAGFGEVSNSPHQPQTRLETPLSERGTAFAINYLTLGVAPHLPSSTGGRGGTRNSASRESFALNVTQVGNLIAAAGFAKAVGLPLTRMVTIHWKAAGVPLESMARATGRFTDLMAKALARHGSGTAWLWTHEAGELKGGHCHLLAHVPKSLVPTFTKLQMRWVTAIAGKPYRAGVIHSRPIGGRLGLETSNPPLYAVNLDAALSYLLKGASEEAAAAFHLEKLEPGGRIIGKRCGTSQNIGVKARKDASNARTEDDP